MKSSLFLFTITVSVATGTLLHAENAANQEKSSSGQQSGPTGTATINESAGAQSGTKINFNDLPADVKKTFENHARGFNIENVQKKQVGGQTVYTGSYDQASMRTRLTVDQNGSLREITRSRDFALGVELPKIQPSQTKLSELPNAVQDTLKKEAGTAQIGNIGQAQLGGQTVYQAAYNEGQVHHELFVSKDGNLVAEAQETAIEMVPFQDKQAVSLQEAPMKVQQAIKDNSKNAQVTDFDKGTWKGQTVYRAMLDDKGKLRQLVFSEEGKLLPQAEQDISTEAAGAHNKKNDSEKDKDSKDK